MDELREASGTKDLANTFMINANLELASRVKVELVGETTTLGMNSRWNDAIEMRLKGLSPKVKIREGSGLEPMDAIETADLRGIIERKLTARGEGAEEGLDVSSEGEIVVNSGGDPSRNLDLGVVEEDH